MKLGTFGRLAVERNRKEPPDKGGRNLIHTWWTAADVINPAVHFGLSAGGPAAWYGWADIPQFEKLITVWLRETDQAKRKGHPQVHRAGFLERDDHVGPIAECSSKTSTASPLRNGQRKAPKFYTTRTIGGVSPT